MGLGPVRDDERDRIYVPPPSASSAAVSSPPVDAAPEQPVDTVVRADTNRFIPQLKEPSAVVQLIKSGSPDAVPRAEKLLALANAKLVRHAIADGQAGAFEAIAARSIEERKYLDALKDEKTPQSAWALLNPVTAAKTIAGHYDDIQIIHDENLAALQHVEHGAKMAAIAMRKHDLTIADLEKMDVKELSKLACGTQNALAIKDCLAYGQRGAAAVDTHYLETEADVISKYVGEQVKTARAYDESLKKSSSGADRAIGHASALILDGVSEVNAEAKESFATAHKFYGADSRKDTLLGKIGSGATTAGEMLASTATMPMTIADVNATDEERSQAVTGTALMLGTMGVMKSGAPAWKSIGGAMGRGTTAALATRPMVWIAESGAGRFVARSGEMLGSLEARFEATALARGADRAKAALSKINTLPEIGVSKRSKLIGESSLDPIPTQGRRNTIGRSGEPTPTPPRDAPHLEAIHRGMQRMPAEVRAHLELLLDGGVEGRAIQSEMATLETDLHGIVAEEATARRALAAGEEGAAAKLEELASRRDVLGPKYNDAANRLERAQVAALPKAAAVMDFFLKDIRRSTIAARELAAQVPIEKDAIKAVAKFLERTPEEAEAKIRSWLTDYFETSDPRVTPKALRMFVDPDDARAYYRHGKGINVGETFDKSTLFHEATHPIEHVDDAASAATKSWRDARAAGVDARMKTKPLRELEPGKKFKPDEVAYANHDFSRDYIGKIYSKSPMTEVLTVFAEQLSDPLSAARLFAQDAEHFFLGLGLLW